MRLLLDTHVFLWWVTRTPRISGPVLSEIRQPDTEIFVSVVTFWEIAIKKSLGRLVYPNEFAAYSRQQLAENDFRALDVTLDHTAALHDLPMRADHRDPFDRMLVAQATAEKLAIVSADAVFDRYPVERVW